MICYKNYIKKLDLFTQTEKNKILYTAFYIYQQSETKIFSISELNELMLSEGIHISNISREKKEIKDSKNYKYISKDSYTLTSTALSKLNKEINFLKNEEFIETDSILLDSNIFCGYKDYLNKLINQINCCYENNCFDACATIMRRVLETLLIESYENNHIENIIKDTNGNYYMLEKICDNAKSNTSLNLSRKKYKLDEFRDLGNYASHGRYYNTRKSDIDKLITDYRIILEELFYKAGLK